MNAQLEVIQLPSRISKAAAQAIADKFAKNKNILSVELDVIAHIAALPSDAYYANQWHYHTQHTEVGASNLPDAWEITTGHEDIVIAVIDTGILPHIDLSGRTLPGYDFISDTDMANDGDGRDNDPNDPGDWISSADASSTFVGCLITNSTWHGTHVAGTIGASANNGGVVGINWTSKILPIRVLGKCGGSFADILDAMRWAAGLTVEGVPTNENPADIINMSLGANVACSSFMQDVIDEIVSTTNTTIVVAAGNSNIDALNVSPAGCDNIITVASNTRTGAKASYSNYGERIDIAAPGGNIPLSSNGVYSTFDSGSQSPNYDNTYASYQGTSMASPHVAGVASLMQSKYYELTNGFLTPTQIRDKLKATTRTFPSSTDDNCTTNLCGTGILDAHQALLAISTTPTAKTGEDQTVETEANVTLDASNSSDDAGIITYQWQQIAGTNSIALNNANTDSPSFTAPATADTLVFELTVTDDIGLTGTDQVTINITPPNAAPVAQNATLVVAEDNAITSTLRATDSENDTLIYSISTSPSHGTVNITNPNTGDYTFTPTANFFGNDSFTFSASDNHGTSNTATIFITVNAINDAPIADDKSFNVDEDTTLTQTLSGQDIESDTLSFALTTSTTHGSLSLNPNNGSFEYSPNNNIYGSDSFTYRVHDGDVYSQTATVNISILSVNDPPNANQHDWTTEEDQILNAQLSGHDIDGDQLTFTIVSNPSKGALELNTFSGEISYTPHANQTGGDSFSYSVNDGQTDSTPATVLIDISEINDTPIGIGETFSLDEESPLSASLTAIDVDDTALSFELITLPEKGQLSLDQNTGAFTYTPNENETGEDSFQFIVKDALSSSQTATTVLNINNINDPPHLSALGTNGVILSVGKSATLSFNVSDADIDHYTDQHTLTSTASTLSQIHIENHTLTIEGIHPGQETLTFTVTDSAGATDSIDLPITINETLLADSNGDGISDIQAAQLSLAQDETSGDSDGDNIPDIFEVGDPSSPIDNDNDNVIDALEKGHLALNNKVISFRVNQQSAEHIGNTQLLNQEITLSTDNGIRLIAHNNTHLGRPLHAATDLATPDPTHSFPYGLYDFSVETEVTSTQVTLTLPGEIVLNNETKLRKFDNTGTWQNFTAFTIDSENNAIILTLNDNDIFDLDPNIGMIRDPVGIAISKPTPSSASGGSGGGILHILWLIIFFIKLTSRSYR